MTPLPTNKRQHLLLCVAGLALLLIAIYMLHFWLLRLALVEGGLAPWDYGLEPRPEGGWQRMVNDFFAGPPGENVPSGIILSAMGLIFLFRLIHTKSPWLLPLEFGAATLVATVGGVVTTLIVSGFYRWLVITLIRPQQQQGFHMTWPTLLVIPLVIVGLLYSLSTGWVGWRIEKLSPTTQISVVLTLLMVFLFLCGPSLKWTFLGE